MTPFSLVMPKTILGLKPGQKTGIAIRHNLSELINGDSLNSDSMSMCDLPFAFCACDHK